MKRLKKVASGQKNRQGQTLFHPILSLAIGVVQPNSKQCKNHHQVAELAAQAKKSAKQQGGNHLYLQPHLIDDAPESTISSIVI